MFLVKIIEKDNPLSYLGLRHKFKKGLRWVSWVSLVFILYFFLNLTVLKNDIDFQMGFSNWLNTILLVGVIEEIVFRGFLLRKLMVIYKFWIVKIILFFFFVFFNFLFCLFKVLRLYIVYF